MKLKTLLLLGGAMAVSSAQAALTVQERKLVLSDPTMADMSADGSTVMYLYNPGTKGFLRGGNNYNTRASVDTKAGYKWKIAMEDADANLVSLSDSVEYDNSNKACTWGWRKMFSDNAEAVYVDNNNGANANAWQLVSVGDGKYRITNTAVLGSDGEALYLGAVDGTTYCNLYAETTENANIDWYAVTPDDYNALVKARGPQVDAFNAAVALYAALQSADADGVPGLEQYEKVYADETATAEAINEATEAVKNAHAAYNASKATADEPVDLSVKITNATFDTVGDFTGWSGTAFSAGGTTGPCAEHYNKTYETWQQIDNLPNGVYALGVDGFYRAGSAENALTAYKNGTTQNAVLFAANIKAGEDAKNDTLTSKILNIFDGIEADKNDVTTGSTSSVKDGDVTYYVPNTMAAAVDYFNAGYYKNNSVMFAVSEGTAKIGVKKSATEGTTDWSIFDNFSLKYYGNGADAYKKWNADVMKNFKEYSEDDQITTSVLEDYKNVIAASADGSTYEEVMKNVAAVEAANKLVEENIAAWKALNDEYEAAKVVVTNPNYQGADVETLSDYLELDYSDIYGGKALSTEEVIAETAKLKEMKENAIQNSITPGTDLTDLIKNPDFSSGKTGWTFEAVSGGNVAANQSAKCAEAWNNANFDIYQSIEGAAVGAYKVTVQGFYRRGRGDNAWKMYFDQTTGEKLSTVPESPAYAYCNDMKTPLANVFDYIVEAADNYYTSTGSNAHYTDAFDRVFPNDMTDAGLAFDHGAYEINATGLVVNKGDALRIGMKGCTNQENDSWAIFTRFKLTYMGDDVDILAPAIEKEVAAIDLTKTMGTDVKAEAQTLISDANKAKDSGVGKDMRVTLGKLLAYEDEIEKSVSLFTTLKSTSEDFLDFLAEAPDEYGDLKAEAGDYVENLKLDNMTNDEANAAITKIADYRHQLSLPVGWKSASDSEPVDMTSLMSTPGFEKDGANSVEGWQNATGYNFGNDASQKAALALEFYDKNFNIYQDVEVPNGTYQVLVNAFNRAGSVANDQTAVSEGTASKALLYAKSGEKEVTKSIEHITSIDGAFAASSEQVGSGNESKFTTADGSTYYCPNDMVSSAAYFDANRYLNGVTVKVTDGKLRIGIRQENKVSGSWVIMDNFKLIYFGDDSKQAEGGFTNVDAVEVAGNVAKIEVYSVDGVKQNAIQKGVNILVITDNNGNVTTKTIIK